MNKLGVFIIFCFLQTVYAQNTPEKFIQSDSAKYYFDLERSETISEKRIELIDRAIEIEKENFFLHNEKANIYYENEKYQDYENYLKGMLILFPLKGEIDTQMGFYEEGLGNRKQADKYYESSIKKINDGLITEKSYQKIVSLNFLKMLNLLFLDRKIEIQGIISNTKEKDAREFFSN